MAEALVGPYRILERLGAGATGVVFLAEDTRLHRRVALKTLSGTARTDASEVRRKLLREARAAARLNHPNIAAVYDVLESEEGVHIVMEYVPGTTLAARIRQGALSHMEVLDIALQLTAALGHAHAQGVVHRDLKPANIMFGGGGQAKILDFGLARLQDVGLGSLALGSSEASTEVRQIVGTPPYMPPEHLRGAAVDARGDVYSLGVTLFELLTGRRPFETSDRMTLADAILTAPTPRARSLSPELPSGLDDVVYRAMARDPIARYPSAAKLESDLSRIRADVTDTPTRSEGWPLGNARGKRWLRGTALATVAVVAGLYGMLGPVRQIFRRTPPSATSTTPGPHVVAVLPLAGAAGDPQTESLAAGVADALITRLSKVPDLTVVSRAGTLKYRDREQQPAAIAKELGATMLVDGLVQRSGDRLRVTVSLLGPASNLVLWQEDYDATFAEVFTLQREVAAAVARELRLRPPAARTTESPPTDDLDAFADFAQARSFLERPDVKDNLERSIKLFQGAIRRDPRFARAHAGLGEAYWRKYQASRDEKWAVEARDAVNEALRLDPNDVSVRVSLAAVYRARGRSAQAVEELQKVIVSRPESDDAHRQLGQLLVEAGRLEEGLQEMNAAIRLRPDYWGHHHTLGAAYYGAGRYGDAVAAFRRVTELQPDNGWGFHMLATSYHALNDTANAKRNYLHAIRLGTPNAHGNLGILYLDEGDVARALEQFQAAVQLAPDSARNQHNLGDAFARLGDTGRATAAYRQAARLSADEVRVDPRNAPALAVLGIVEAKLGQYRDAVLHVARAISLAPRDPDVRYAEAVVRTLNGQREQGLVALEAAVAAGYSRERLGRDPDLSPLRSDPRYAALLARSNTSSTERQD
jgi:serine/threonine-protein kinase